MWMKGTEAGSCNPVKNQGRKNRKDPLAQNM